MLAHLFHYIINIVKEQKFMPITQKKKIYKILAFGLAIALLSTIGLSSKGPPKKKPHRLADNALNTDGIPIKVYFDT